MAGGRLRPERTAPAPANRQGVLQPSRRATRQARTAQPQKVLHGVTDTLIRAHQHGERGFYQFGETADWIYEPPAKIGQIGAGDPVTVKLNDWHLFDRVDPRGRFVPSLVAGDVTSGTPPRRAHGDRGQRAGRSDGRLLPFKARGPARSFAGLVPESLYKPGPGHPQLQLYLATSPGELAPSQRRFHDLCQLRA